MRKSNDNEKKGKIAKLITEAIDEGSEHVTSLSENPSSELESIGPKEPGINKD